jgi:hypothetical protein
MHATREEELMETGTTPEAPKTGVEAIIDAVADLLQTFVDWLRQEAAAVMREKIVLPIQKLGLTLASATAAAMLAVTGLIFIAVALFLLLAQWVGYPFALLIIGAVYLIASAVFLVIKVRSMQK